MRAHAPSNHLAPALGWVGPEYPPPTSPPQDFLVNLTCAEEPGKDNMVQEPARLPTVAGRLLQIQEIADEEYKRELIATKGAGGPIPPAEFSSRQLVWQGAPLRPG